MDRPDSNTASIRRLQREHVPAVTRVLAEAFHDYPVMRYVLGRDSPERSGRLDRLIHFFIMARVLRGEPVLGLASGDGITAVALVSYPDGPPSPPELDVVREGVWAELGEDARLRYEEFGAAWKGMALDVPHIRLNMIGVRPSLQGHGHGRRLLDEVHALSRERADSTGVVLTTEVSANLALYEHFGYEITGHARIGGGCETWTLFRPC
jgi:GNAT superfamily N-acetyltransferase